VEKLKGMSKNFGYDVTDKLRTACVNAVLVAMDPRESSTVGDDWNIGIDLDEDGWHSRLVKTSEDDCVVEWNVTCVSVSSTSIWGKDSPEVTDFYVDTT
jgi:hypothetical protein